MLYTSVSLTGLTGSEEIREVDAVEIFGVVIFVESRSKIEYAYQWRSIQLRDEVRN